MNKLILALTAALLAGSAMAASAPKANPATGVEKSAAATPKAGRVAHHQKLAHHHKGIKAHRKAAA